MERVVVERSNMRLAYQRVVENKGAAGVDEMPVSELKDWLVVHWPSVKKALLEGRYLPQPVRRVDIPKPNGGVRTLGVPTVVDRLIQQALHQVLQPLFDPTFSEGSYGCNIYVGSRAAGERVMSGIRVFLEDALRLRVNAEKSAVARPWARKFLGFSVTAQRETRLRIAKDSVQRLMQRVRELSHTGRGRSLRHTIEELTPLLRGWIHYFRLTESKGVLHELDGWVRRRLRCLLWRQWKRGRTRTRKLRALGLAAERARISSGNGHGAWWNAGASHMNQALPAAYFTRMGAGLAGARTPATPECSLNRRMRNRTSGGGGGRRA